MADTKISALTAVTAVLAAQEFAVNDAGTSKKATATQIKTWANCLGFLGRTQLSANNANIVVSFSAMDGFFILAGHIQGYTGSDTAQIRIDNNSSAIYSTVASEPADAAHTASTIARGLVLGESTQTTPRSPVYCFVNKASSSQPAFMRAIQGDGSSSAATAIAMIDSCAVWQDTSSQISSFTLFGGQGGASLLAGSYLEVYGIANAASA